MLSLQSQDMYDAAKSGNVADVVAALDAGANINWKNKDDVRRQSKIRKL